MKNYIGILLVLADMKKLIDWTLDLERKPDIKIEGLARDRLFRPRPFTTVVTGGRLNALALLNSMQNAH